MVCQTRVRQEGRRDYTKHMLRLRHPSLAWFRAADNAKPQDLIDVALGRQDELAGQYGAHTAVPTHDMRQPIKRWNRNYIITLKMVELEQLAQLRPVERVLSLFDWMRTPSCSVALRH